MAAREDIELIRASVTDLLTAYWYDVDHTAGANAHTFFTEDGVLTFDKATHRGRDAIAQMYRERAARGPRTSRHIVTNVHVTAAASGLVHVDSILCLFAHDGPAPQPTVLPAAVADVSDDLARVDGRVLISRRKVTTIFIDPATELAVPTR